MALGVCLDFRPCLQAMKKGAHLSFHCLLTWKALVNQCGNKHEKACAIKRKLSACLFSRKNLPDFFK